MQTGGHVFGKGVEGGADRPGSGALWKDIKGNQILTILLRLKKSHGGLTCDGWGKGGGGGLLECRGMHVVRLMLMLVVVGLPGLCGHQRWFVGR